ncbi:MAG: hypothetical protein AAF531_00305 [Actinomycetota bacterium]
MHVSHADQPDSAASGAAGAFGASGDLFAELGTLHVLGGKQRNPAGMRELDTQWYGYGNGVAIELTDGSPAPAHEWHSRPGTYGPDDPILFKSAQLVGDLLYACSQTEAMIFRYPDFELLHHISHPLFNDVHHAVPGPMLDAASSTGQAGSVPDTVCVAVSGQDAVMEVSLDGELVGLWRVDGRDHTGLIDQTRDYRINTKLKPHASHPNYLFRMPDGKLWVNRFETRDAVQVGDVSRRIGIERERCHDGVVLDGLVHFTTVDGHVVAADTETLEVVREQPLSGKRDDGLLGWCRGLTFIGDHAVVGFSRIRHTKVRGALSWVRTGFTHAEPTRIAVYDRRTWALVDEVDLEPAGCNAVFSIISEQQSGGHGG